MVDEPPAPSRPGPYVRLTVSDSGVGIPAGVLSRIFDPFFSTKGRGSGLGLTVTHSIVARHGGYVEVSSRPGEGTRFEINLPAQPGVGPAEEPAPPAPGRLSARVLLMDDEESIRSVGARALTLAGCAVETAANGAAALAAFETARRTGAPFDVVILDLTVPEGMGGLEALEALRRLDPAVCAVASSGYSMAAAMSDFRARGFAAALPKPWSVTQLRQVVAALEQGAAPPGGT
jgi:CheY-like chemotaxis protein